MNKQDPAKTNPDKYKVVFENDKVRVLEYKDKPGDITTPHTHPDSVMITMSDFDRRLHFTDSQVAVKKQYAEASWLPAQEHAGENIGTTNTHVFLIELK